MEKRYKLEKSRVVPRDMFSRVIKLLPLIAFAALLFHANAWAQSTQTVSGVVTDAATGDPLPGVNISIQGTVTGTATDSDGEYSLNLSNPDATLIVSFIGYETQEVELNGRQSVDITLSQSTVYGEELVVVGYGQQKAGALTGSISHVSREDVLSNRAVNVGQALQGKVAGVQVVQMGSGEPGGRPMIRIRGTNSINTDSDPLFVVDGIVGVGNPLETLNPNDITSIDILKDASATAIYGARGANGVVIVTTNRGTAGSVQVNYRGSTSVGVMNRNVYNLNADQTMYVYLQSLMNGDKYSDNINRNGDFRAGHATGDTFDDKTHLFRQVNQGEYMFDLQGASGAFYAPRFNSDWEEKMFGSPAVSGDHHLEVSGGSQNARYSLSLGYSDENGLMRESWFKRYQGRVTADVDITERLSLSSQLGFTNTESTDDGGITRSTTEVWAFLPERYPNDPSVYGSYAGRWGTNADFGIGEQWYNVMFRRSEILGRNNRNQVTGSISLDAVLSDNFTFITNFATDFNNRKSNEYEGRLYGGSGEAEIGTQNRLAWQNENYLNYDNTFGGVHNVAGVLGLSWSQSSWEETDMENSVFFSDFYRWHNIGVGASSRPDVDSEDGKSSLNSYFGRVNYDYDERYLLTVTGRIDGSSKFGPNTKYGFFPSAGVAWNVSSEEWYQGTSLADVMTFAKLRASYGITGNQEIGSYVTQQFIGSTNVPLGSSIYTGIYPSAVGNPDLKWEETSQYDIGAEVSFWDDRLSLTVDYYHKETTDMLLNVPLPHSTTTGSATLNYGSVENKGWEFGLSTQNILTDDFTWSTNLMMSANQNEITGLGPTGDPIYIQTGAGNASTVLMEGEAIGSFFGLNRVGTWNTDEATEAARYGLKPGDLKHEDVDNDGQIDFISDGDIIGSAWPRILANIQNHFTYRNWDAYLDISIAEGFHKGFVRESAEDRQLVSGGLNSTLTAWRPDQQITGVAQMRPGSLGAYYLSNADTHIISDASFIRGSGATLGYSLPANVVDRIGLAGVRLYLQASNFFLITEAEGYDPEGSSLDKQSPLAPGQDKYAYPRPSTYTFGVDINF